MKSLTSFVQCVLIDLGTWCRVSTTRDLTTVASRVEHEGVSFLTITLSDFGKELQKALDQGHVGHDQFRSFSRTGGLPRFLGGFLDLVFDRKTGRLLDDPCIEAIHALRQFSLMWAKIGLRCTPRREAAAFAKYVECEQDVRATDASLSSFEVHAFRRISRLLWAPVLSAVNNRIAQDGIIPRHGPGKTAEGVLGNAKYDHNVWTQRLEKEFSFTDHLFPNWRYSNDSELASSVVHLEPGAETPVKVVAVPKTLKTPRIIAMEPVCMMFVQEGVKDLIEEEIESNDTARSLIGYLDDSANHRLAQIGSLNGSYATLDLSEASDRVSNQHVRWLLEDHAWLASAVDSSRSRKADVPGHGVSRLAKFASMGSALCFPMEAMIFTTVVFMGIERALNRPLTAQDVRFLRRSVRVFGDDIVVPSDYALSVVDSLESFGFKVNRDKSFWTGKFRESCGEDYYAGHSVKVVKMRSVFPTRRQNVREIVATVAFRNQLYEAGLWRSAALLDDVIRKFIPFPIVEATSPILGRHSFLRSDPKVRWCRKLHVPLVKGVVVTSVLPAYSLEGHGALLKCLTIRGEVANPDARHLERSGRPFAVDIEQRWAPSF